MGNLIEKAALRLEQLRQAGVQVDGDGDVTSAPPRAPGPAGIAGSRPGPRPVGRLPLAHGAQRVELDLRALAARGMLVPDGGRPQLAAEYRIVKRPLIRNAMGLGGPPLPRGNLIMVTSAGAGEGKTFTSLNLAMSIATEMDHSVLLVDADVARPSLGSLLGLPAGPGLLDLLTGQAEMREVVLRTNVDKLSVLRGGHHSPHANELLASAAMGQLLDEMASRDPGQLVIFDSPPLLVTTEARELASQMGQVVLVIQAEKTPHALVRHALSTIEGVPACMLLLNGTRPRAWAGPDAGLGYGYGYGYGHEAGPPADRHV